MSSLDESDDAARQLREQINGFRATQLLSVAARLELADLLGDGPKSGGELAAATGANADALLRLLRTLASLGVFAEPAPDQFALTPVAALLRREHPQSLWAVSRMAGEEQYRAWGGLYDSVMTGAPAFPQIYGMRRFDYLAQHPDAEAIFSQGMSEKVRLTATAFAAAYPFPSQGTVVDVGGGHGVLLGAALRAHPSLRGVLFDQPQVVAGAAATLEAAGVTKRCAVVGGDFFVAVPSGGSVYVLCEVIHDWNDERALQILRRCAEVMEPEAKLVLVENVITSGAAAPARLLDLHMLVMHGGRERATDEFARLFAAAGLRLTRTIPLDSGESMVEGERAPAR
jgi:O-methyltransferase/methyltransferase family protein